MLSRLSDRLLGNRPGGGRGSGLGLAGQGGSFLGGQAGDRRDRTAGDADGPPNPNIDVDRRTDGAGTAGIQSDTGLPVQIRAAALEVQAIDVLAAHPEVQCGVFGADMQVALLNDGPVTFLLEV